MESTGFGSNRFCVKLHRMLQQGLPSLMWNEDDIFFHVKFDDEFGQLPTASSHSSINSASSPSSGS